MTELWLAGGFFLFVLSAITVAGYLLLGRNSMAGETALPGATPVSVVTPDAVETEGLGIIVRAFQLVGQAMPGVRSGKHPLRRKLLLAGYRLPSAVAIFEGIKCAFALTLGVIALWLATALGSNGFLAFFGGIGFGFLAPERVLDWVIAHRARRLRQGLAPALDMMLLAVEAGQSIDQAFIATCRGLKNTHPDLSAELTILHLEARASNNRIEALRNFASRNSNEKELKKFANLLIDTDRFGTGVGPALRDHAKYLRIRSRQQAQEAARKVGVKLIFPVFFLIFPSVILVTLGPAVILIFTQMKALIGN